MSTGNSSKTGFIGALVAVATVLATIKAFAPGFLTRTGALDPSARVQVVYVTAEPRGHDDRPLQANHPTRAANDPVRIAEDPPDGNRTALPPAVPGGQSEPEPLDESEEIKTGPNHQAEYQRVYDVAMARYAAEFEKAKTDYDEAIAKADTMLREAEESNDGGILGAAKYADGFVRVRAADEKCRALDLAAKRFNSAIEKAQERFNTSNSSLKPS